MKKGFIIVIEGSTDGVGKSKQTELLYERLVKDGYDVITHHFPTYNTYHGAFVEKYLKGEYGNKEKLSPYFINSLYAIDRAVVWHTKLKEAYKDGKIILLDRYTSSSIIYQSAYLKGKAKKDFIDYISDYEHNKLETKRPDMMIFLTAPFELLSELREKRNKKKNSFKDIHEIDTEYLKKVYDSSIFIAKYLNWNIIECSEKKKIRSIEDIHEEIYNLVKKKIK